MGVFLVVCIVIVSIVDLHYVGPYCHASKRGSILSNIDIFFTIT